ncbi:hypothetical protein DSECCO2_601930 [anaerobic digester metagenome]
MKILKVFTLLTALLLAGKTLCAQNDSYLAYFSNTEQTVYRDSKERLVMSYQIEGPSTQAEIEALKRLFLLYNMFEKFEINPTSEPDVWDIEELTRPAVKIKDHRKLFAVAGIYTIFIDNEPYPVDGFRMKMLKK